MIKEKGLTLVEILVVISLLSVVGVLILTIFTRTLRGGNKTEIISAIKQNGQSVLETMDKTVRDSDNVVCPAIIPPNTNATSDNLVVVNNGIYIRYRFVNLSSTSVNGLIQQDNPAKEIIPETGKEETDSALVNRICPSTDPLVQPVTLTDTNLQTGISVMSGSFTRDQSAGYKDQVTIKFSLKPALNATQAVAGQIDPVSFQTTIQLR